MIIALGQFSWNYLLIALFPIIIVLQEIIEEAFKDKDAPFNINEHPFLCLFLRSCFGLLTGLHLVISSIFQRFDSKGNRLSSLLIAKTNLITTVQFAKTHYKLKLIICCFISTLLNEMFYLVSNYNISRSYFNKLLFNHSTVFEIIFCGLLSFPIIRYRLYRHHFLSIGLIVIGFLLISIPLFSHITHWTITLIFLMSYLLWSLQIVFAKWIMQKFSVNAMMVLFTGSACLFTLCTVLIAPFMYTPCSLSFCHKGVIEPFVSTFKAIAFSKYTCLSVFLTQITYLIENIISSYLNERTTPTHSAMCEMLDSVVLWVYFISTEKRDEHFSMSLCGFVIIVIASLIYNEMVLIYVCSLAEFTREEINKRSQIDYAEVGEIMNQSEVELPVEVY